MKKMALTMALALLMSGTAYAQYSFPHNNGPSNFSVISNVAYVDGVTHSTIAAAYASLPSGGGRVYIPAGNYTVALGTLVISKPVRFECEDRKTTTITFTGASGIAFLFNYATSPTGDYRDWGNGIFNCQLIGPGGLNGGAGNAGIGIQIGDGGNAPIGTLVDNNLVAGFTEGITWGNVNAWGSRIVHSTFLNNTQNFVWSIASAGGMENLQMDHDVFSQTAASPVYANDFQVAGSGVLDMSCIYCSFDNSQISISGSSVNKITFVSKHQELLADATTSLMAISSGTVVDISPFFALDGVSTSPVSIVTVSAGQYSINDGHWQATTAPTQAILQSGTANVVMNSPFLFDSNVPGFTAGGSGYAWNCEPENGFCNSSSSITAGTYLSATSTLVASLPAAATGNKGQMRIVSDSTTVASEGQTCVGSSTVTAMAFSNGSVWKCF